MEEKEAVRSVAKFSKRVVDPGPYTTPSGVQVVDAARVRHWADSINRMVERGYKPPCSWGHAASASPHKADDAEFWKEKFNAGRIERAEVAPGDVLVLHGDAPGLEMDGDRLVAWQRLPDGTEVRTAVEEVSIGACDWTDGDGTRWPDCPVHLAFTPLPVWVPDGGQPGFAPSAPAHFGTSTKLATEGRMADDKKDDGPPKKDGDGKGGEGGAEFSLGKLLKALADFGLPLPPNTNDENFKEYLFVALTAVAGATDGKGGDILPADAAPPPGPPAMMATVPKDPFTLALLARQEQDDRAKRIARVDALTRRGVPYSEVKRLREEVGKVKFSVLPTGQVVTPSVDEHIAILERCMPEQDATTLFATLAGAATEEPPEGAPAAQERKKHQELADEMSRRAGLPARKGA